MKFAVVEGERREAQPGLSGKCPVFGDAMIAKCGNYRVWHWAHRGTRTCDPWCKLGHDIAFGIGIANGFATLGTIGFEGRFEYAAIGIVSNVASRLCDEAKPGQILISPRVLMAVEKDIAVEPVWRFCA
jgi:class 3 adenylate cyclase